MPGIDDSIPGANENGLVLSRKRVVTGASLAAVANGFSGVITTEALSTAAAAAITYVITNNKVTAASNVLANVGLGSSTTGTPTIASVTPGAGTISIVVQNIHASVAFNGTLKLGFVVH